MQNFDFEPSIIQKTYQLYLEIHKRVEKFQKINRYSLGQKIENTALDLFENIFLANMQVKTLREPIIHRASAKCELVKMLIRLSYDISELDAPHYISLEAKIQEVGKMLGGWIKYLRKF